MSTPSPSWAPALERLCRARRLLVALDFDGTLAPLVTNPEDSRILPEGVLALARLAEVPTVRLALVSGRPARDLARLAQVPDGTYAVGSHGAEFGMIEDGQILLEPAELSAERRKRLDAIGRALESLIIAQGSPEGAWVEFKPVAAVLHTRLVSSDDDARRLSLAAERVGTDLGGHVLNGKKVVEISVVPVGKAGALRHLREQTGADLVFFAGDDVTDELALRSLRETDVGFKVGEGPTSATYRVRDPQEMCEFLAALADGLDRTT
jgi:trehalose-phosphatase